METIRIFSAPHKEIRKTMSAFLVLAGQTNFKNEKAIEKLKFAGNEMFFLLTSHAETEDKIVLNALEMKLPGASEHDKNDHVKIHQLQHKLEVQLNRLSTSVTENEAHEFYLKFASFFSLYLEHIDEEETVTQKLIWENFSTEEQMAIRTSIVAKMKPETYAIWLKHIIPAQNETENLAMLGAVLRNMLSENFEALLKVLEQNMSEEDFSSLKLRVFELNNQN
jgi:hemerythrin-like domain-containing protein